jgi:hypothetical protein
MQNVCSLTTFCKYEAAMGQDLVDEQLFLLTVITVLMVVSATIMWILYLIRIVTNEDRIKEKIKREKRKREEKARIEADRRKKAKENGMDAVSAALSANSAPQENTPEEGS